MTAAASLLSGSVPIPMFIAAAVVVLLMTAAHQVFLIRHCSRLVREAEAELRRLEQRADEYEARIDAELVELRAEVDAYGAWSDANDRFFHHGLVAVSHLLGARALPARRACASERRSTQVRRATETAWRPVPIRTGNSTPSIHPAMRVLRRTCQ